MRFFFLFVFSISTLLSQAQAELHRQNQTYTYDDLIAAYQALDEQYEALQLVEYGKTDAGLPLHLVVIAKGISSSHPMEMAKAIKAAGKSVLLINNGIHPGEACGINAAYLLAKRLLAAKEPLLEQSAILIVPVYNIGGALNRGCCSRANQNGPEMHGFRGNAKNLDLNRDFIKCDSKNARALSQIFRDWDPDVFVDTHTTNGSDHPYTLTLIASQKDKLSKAIGDYQEQVMLPSLYREMESRGKQMTPYIYPMKKDPANGIKDFLETPRYSSGYAALFHCFSFITEAHVFKSFENRVEHTLAFLEVITDFTATKAKEIIARRNDAKAQSMQQRNFPVQWSLDSSKKDQLSFRGYETVKRKSAVTDQEMMFYDQQKPYQKAIDYYHHYKVDVEVEKPAYYLIPQAYEEVIERLRWNGIQMEEITENQEIEVEVYYIEDYQTLPRPFEAHYLHYDVQVRKDTQKINFRKGDLKVSTAQERLRYLIETLEPQAVDAFFAWNFFDNILQQKEWFSDYAFEPKAAQLLSDRPDLRKSFEERKLSDTAFAKNNFAQLYFLYQQSPYFEKSYRRYPIFRGF